MYLDRPEMHDFEMMELEYLRMIRIKKILPFNSREFINFLLHPRTRESKMKIFNMKNGIDILEIDKEIKDRLFLEQITKNSYDNFYEWQLALYYTPLAGRKAKNEMLIMAQLLTKFAFTAKDWWNILHSYTDQDFKLVYPIIHDFCESRLDSFSSNFS